MASISFSGLGSGLDTGAIVKSLMQIEREPVTRLEQRIEASKARVARLDDLRTRLEGVRTAAAGLRDADAFRPQPSARSSDASRVAGTADASAPRATYAIEVRETARAGVSTQGSSVAAAASADVLHVSAGATFDVAIDAGDDIATVARKINDANGGASASVVDGKLRLTSRETGAANGPSLTSDGGLAASLGMTTTIAARDARFTVDGTERTSASNSVDGAIAGVRLDLKAATSGPVTLDVDPARVDSDAIVGRMKAFVSAYNGLVDAAETAIAERPTRTPTTDVERRRGVLFGDQNVAALLEGARRSLQDPVDGASSAVDTGAELGLSTGAPTGASGTTSGRLVLDEARLRAAVEADPGAVEEALGRSGTGSGRGLMQRVDDLAQRFGSSVDSVLRSRSRSEGERIADWQGVVERTDERLQKREERLRTQFTAMERALGQLRTLQGALAPGSAAA